MSGLPASFFIGWIEAGTQLAKEGVHGLEQRLVLRLERLLRCLERGQLRVAGSFGTFWAPCDRIPWLMFPSAKNGADVRAFRIPSAAVLTKFVSPGPSGSKQITTPRSSARFTESRKVSVARSHACS